MFHTFKSYFQTWKIVIAWKHVASTKDPSTKHVYEPFHRFPPTSSVIVDTHTRSPVNSQKARYFGSVDIFRGSRDVGQTMRICSAFRKEPRVPETKQEAGAVGRGSRKTRLADIFSPSASDRWKLYWISRTKKKKKGKNRARFRIIRSNSIIGIQKQGGKLFMPDRSLNSPWPWPLSNYSHPLSPRTIIRLLFGGKRKFLDRSLSLEIHV